MNDLRLSEMLDRLAGDVPSPDVARLEAGAKRRRRRRQSAVAVAVVVTVLAAGAMIATIGGDRGDRTVSATAKPRPTPTLSPIGLADDGSVWPVVSARPTDATRLAERFATEVLAWDAPRINFDTTPASAPVWVTIERHDGKGEVRALLAPLDGGWAFMQIGGGVVVTRVDDGQTTLRVQGAPERRYPVDGPRATHGVLWWTRTGTTELHGSAPRASLVTVGAPAASVRSALVALLDGSGSVVTAYGGAFSALSPGKGRVLESPDLAVRVTPASGPPGTVVQIVATGCDDPTGQNHAVSFNNNAEDMTARFDPNTVQLIDAQQEGTTLTGTYVIRQTDVTGGAGMFFVQCVATTRTAPFTVTPPLYSLPN